VRFSHCCVSGDFGNHSIGRVLGNIYGKVLSAILCRIEGERRWQMTAKPIIC